MTIIQQVFNYLFLELAVDLAVVAVFLLVACSSGYKFLKALSSSVNSLAEELLLSLALGSGLIAVTTLILGHFHMLYSSIFWAMSVMVIILSRNDIRNIFKRARGEFSSLDWNPSLITSVAMTVLIIHLFYCTTLALLPEYNMDATAYHIAIGSLFKQHHKIIHIPFMFYGEWPHLSEMVQLFLTMLFKSSVINKLVNFSFYLMLLLATYIMGRRFLPARFALLGCAIFSVSTDRILIYLVTVKEEFLLAVFLFSAYIALLNYLKSKKVSDIFLVFLFLAFGAGTKLIFGFFPLVVIGIFFIVVAPYKKIFSVKKIFAVASSMILFVLLSALPWYWGQITVHHNPFYPLDPFHTVATGDRAGAGYMGASDDKVNQLVVRHLLHENSTKTQLGLDIIKGYALFLWRMTTEPSSFASSISYSFIIILGCILFTKRPYPLELIYHGLFTVLLYSVYFISPAEIGRFFPLYASMAILCAYILHNICMNRRRIAYFVLSIVFLILGNDLVAKNINYPVVGGIKSYWPVLVGLETRHERLVKETWGITRTAEFIDNSVKKNAKLFFYPLICGYYFNRDYIWGDKLHAGDFMGYSNMRGPADLLMRLKALGITHMVVDKGYWPPRGPYKEEDIHKWVAEMTQTDSYFMSYFMFGDKNLALYRLRYDFSLRGAPVWIEESPDTRKKITEGATYGITVSRYASYSEYAFEALLQSMPETVEVKGGEYGQLFMKGPEENEFHVVAQWAPLILGGIGGGRQSVPVKALITPYVKGNGLYQFKFIYIHGPAPVLMSSPRMIAYKGEER